MFFTVYKAPLKNNQKPRILQKFKRESSTPNRQSTTRISSSTRGIHIETQTEWSWIQDMALMDRIRKGWKFI